MIGKGNTSNCTDNALTISPTHLKRRKTKTAWIKQLIEIFSEFWNEIKKLCSFAVPVFLNSFRSLNCLLEVMKGTVLSRKSFICVTLQSIKLNYVDYCSGHTQDTQIYKHTHTSLAECTHGMSLVACITSVRELGTSSPAQMPLSSVTFRLTSKSQLCCPFIAVDQSGRGHWLDANIPCYHGHTFQVSDCVMIVVITKARALCLY